MLVGSNYTNINNLDFLKRLYREGKIDFIEILVDNVYFFSGGKLVDMFEDIPVSFHIMNSDFISEKDEKLQLIADEILRLKAVLKPIYVSDHLGMHSYNNISSPLFLECNYLDDHERIIKRIKRWRTLLGNEKESIYLENFASHLDIGREQPKFMAMLQQSNICDTLFDISNAILSTKNARYPLLDWYPVADKSERFHISSYRKWSDLSDVLIDSHDTNISQESLEFLRSILKMNSLNTNKSIVIEHDNPYTLNILRSNIGLVRGILNV